MRSIYRFLFASSVVAAFSGLIIFSDAHIVPFSYSPLRESLTDTPIVDTPVDLIYPFEDHHNGDFFNENDFDFDFEDPDNFHSDIIYDPESGNYIISETVGGIDTVYEESTFMSSDEFLDYYFAQQEQDYWEDRANGEELLEQKGLKVKIYEGDNVLDRIFGGTSVDIRPQGNIDLTFGGNYQNIENPTLTEQQRKQGGFDFDMNINMNVIGKIGEKLKLNTNYNTQATFDFENQIKLNYEGDDDEIIQKIEAGNVSFPLSTTLIQGSQSLFGLGTELQFGRLTIKAVISQQKSQAETITIENGAQTQTFEVEADQYDENRHFFTAHYFRDHYNNALKNLPIISSPVNVNKIEVWVTNKTGTTQNVRDIVAFADLGENDLAHIHRDDVIIPSNNNEFPRNRANNLYEDLTANESIRLIDNVVGYVTGAPLNLQPVQDFEKTYGRQLSQSEFSFNPLLGTISINQSLQPDEVLAVAYEYTANGEVYKVGEFAQDIPPDSNSTGKVLFLKMLKSTSVRPKLPIWNLMMKNVYSLGAYQVNTEDFQLDVYYQDPGGGLKRYLPEGQPAGKRLLSLLNLDNLNSVQSPQPDGLFDFVPGVTINPQNGRIFFPVLEPFGDDLRNEYAAGEDAIADKYVFDLLYDSTKTIAQQFPEFNRFLIKGSYKSNVTNEISLGAFNIPQGSVKVTAGGQQLVENQDYRVDYSLGRITILNEGILNAGVPINVSFENNALFAIQTKTMFGTRLDYWINDHFTLGGTIMRLNERPFTPKVNIGEDPIANTIYGFDVNYSQETPWITRMVSKLPFYDTKEKSSFNFTGEVAYLKPGHSKAIGKDGTVYVDDFEGSKTSYDLKFPANAWHLASTPNGATRPGVNGELFPESIESDSLKYGYNRAKLAWYNLDPLFTRDNSATPSHIAGNDEEQDNPYVIEVNERDIFPNKSFDGTFSNISTFDLAFYPKERGPYNFELPTGSNYSAGLNTDGSLIDPESRWGGIQRDLDVNDFEASNIEFVEFWVMDPFIFDSDNEGDLFLNLGNVSEDVLRDGSWLFENGLDTADFTQTVWGHVPQGTPINNYFNTDPASRAYQDVGYDGIATLLESGNYQEWLDSVQNYLIPSALAKAQTDPSNDNYHYYRGDDYDQIQLGILQRYKQYNGPDGNSPVSENNADFSSAQTNIPESEDMNHDNTVTENEEYFQYRVHLANEMKLGEDFLADTVRAPLPDDNFYGLDSVTWFHFKIPVDEYDDRVGNIQDFKSIRFMRMYMTGFQDSTILRFARLELVRNQWRRYLFSLLQPGEYIPDDQGNETFFNVSAVNIEENSSNTPVPYVLPPGIDREISLVQNNVNALQNEQSMQLQVCNLQDGDARAVYKTLNLDIRKFDSLKMFIHAESLPDADPIFDNEMHLFIRMGSDFKENYYEYEIPLKITDETGLTDNTPGIQDIVWPEENLLNIALTNLVDIKVQRGVEDASSAIPYSIIDGKGNRITVLGNPDLGLVKTVMIGLRNPKMGTEIVTPGDDSGLPLCAEVWVNELRLLGLNEKGGYAALSRVEVKMADLGNMVVSGNMHSIGFGQLEQKLNERFKDNFYQYDAAITLQLGKVMPKFLGITLPMYASVTESFSNPEYDPYELDVPMTTKLGQFTDATERKEYKRSTQNYVRIKSLNFSNVRKQGMSKKNKIYPWDLETLNATYAFTETYKSDPLLDHDLVRKTKVSLGYNYTLKPLYISPFKKLIKWKSKYFDLIKDININFVPNNFSFSNDVNRKFGERQIRNIDNDPLFVLEPTYDKEFKWDRFYALKYNPFKSLTFDFNAVNNSWIDEPFGKIDTDLERDTIIENFKKLGRNTAYKHSADANYTLPINKIPILDWVSIKAGYGTDYGWTAAPLIKDENDNLISHPFGNTINNKQDIRLNGEFNIKNFYNKWKWLKLYNGTPPQKKGGKDEKKDDGKKDDGKKDDGKNEDDKKKKQPTYNPYFATIINPIISFKRLTVNYTEGYGTTVPGYLPKTEILGQQLDQTAPGWDFIFGYQPDKAWLDQSASKGWITNDPALNYKFMQSFNQNLNIKATFEPYRDLRLDLNWQKTYSEMYSEYFRYDTAQGLNEFVHYNGIMMGSHTVSWITWKTMFDGLDADGFSETFELFEANRDSLSQQLGLLNPYSDGPFFNPEDSTSNPLYAYGYGPYSQDVLIPSFLAAYTGINVNEVGLNAFQNRPKPNWRITYDGLNKLPFFKEFLTSASIKHAYNSTVTINSFTTDLQFEDINGFGFPSATDTITGNFEPELQIPQIVISEQLAPLIGIDLTFTNSITAKFEYKNSRTLTMSFVNYQLNEQKNNEFTIGLGYRLKGLVLPIKIRGKKQKLDNDVNFKFDFSIRDNVTYIHKLDQDQKPIPTSGMRQIKISPSIDYVINNRLNIRLFFDRTRTIPHTSQSYPITNAQGGVTIRFTLGE